MSYKFWELYVTYLPKDYSSDAFHFLIQIYAPIWSLFVFVQSISFFNISCHQGLLVINFYMIEKCSVHVWKTFWSVQNSRWNSWQTIFRSTHLRLFSGHLTFSFQEEICCFVIFTFFIHILLFFFRDSSGYTLNYFSAFHLSICVPFE